MQFQLAGLASGFDWRTMIDQLIAIERIPQNALRDEQSENTNQITALNQLNTKLETLDARLGDLKSTSIYNSKSTSVSDENLNISASADTSAVQGTYQFAISQLATATRRIGTSDVGGDMGTTSTVITNLRLATDITEGTFSINGQEITVASTDTLQDVFDAISAATSGVVSASYDSGADTVTLTSSSGQLDLGGSDDTSNFLDAMRLKQLEVQDAGGGSSEVTSTKALGVVDLDSSIASSGISGPITGSGTIFINGIQIDYDADTESIQTLMNRVNASDADVTMTYDTAADQFRIVNNQTGAYEMNAVDDSNTLLAALGLDGSATVGNDLSFSVDGGATITSRDNVISSEDHGITGLTVTATEVGTQSITIARDSAELKDKINTFIQAYNDVQDFILEKTKIEVEDGEVTSDILARNREVSTLSQKLRSEAFQAVSGMTGDIFRLEHLGIDFISDTSKLEIKDSDALDNALSNELDTLQTFFMEGDDSFATRMEDFIQNYTISDGIIDIQTDNLTEANNRIDDTIETMERRIEFQQAALEAAFIAMEEAQAKIQNQSSALSSLTTI